MAIASSKERAENMLALLRLQRHMIGRDRRSTHLLRSVSIKLDRRDRIDIVKSVIILHAVSAPDHKVAVFLGPLGQIANAEATDVVLAAARH